MKLFLQKNAKFSSAGGFAPRPPLASGGWGLRPLTPQTAPPLRISGNAPARAVKNAEPEKSALCEHLMLFDYCINWKEIHCFKIC